MAKQRYFLVTTAGKNEYGQLSFNSFDFKSIDKHPTMKELIQDSNKLFPNFNDVIVLAISELNKKDWDIFVSEQ